jgi:glutamate/tyrosine decarboxylase-like PLP-dependent enzyme
MNPVLQSDTQSLDALLSAALDEASQFLRAIGDSDARPVLPSALNVPPTSELPDAGLGTTSALARFRERYAAALTGSAGPRYFGFVTGGSTPAALVGDWLTSAFDQNAADRLGAAALIENDAIAMLRALLGLPDAFNGVFVSGATMANFSGLAQARQWLGQQHGVDVALDGLAALPAAPIVLSGSPHSCIYKALSMLGIGRAQLRQIARLPQREAIDVSALRNALAELNGAPCVVVANAGVVNTVDFDDIAAIAALRADYPFWLHVDAAFGGFAAVSPRYAHLVDGWQQADSIAVDAHKWLNVPYDSAMVFTRHIDLQVAVFQNAAAAYLGAPSSADFVHLTPENSRRLRALPAWFRLTAYGRAGYRDIVERTCALAQQLGERIEASQRFRLLAPVRMNVVCFAPIDGDVSIAERLARIHATGKAFFTPTIYEGVPAIRAAFSNWRTTPGDVALAWEALQA